MSSHDRYTIPAEFVTWALPAAGDVRFTWEYDEPRDRLLQLYQRGKDRQWDGTKRIDWDQQLDPDNPLRLPDEFLPIFGSQTWQKLGPADISELRRHTVAWQFSQFLHGEQGAMICSARIVESAPDLDAKFFATTQTMDEARHAEVYARLLDEKIGLLYPINRHLKALLDDTLSDSRWDLLYLGMQVLIEGLALAAFGILRTVTTVPLPKQILAYVMQDEARHVAFGRLALRDVYSELTRAELSEREDFVIEGCYLMRDRFRGDEVWDNLGYDQADCREAAEGSIMVQRFRSLLFSRIVPCLRDVGLWSPRVRQAFLNGQLLSPQELPAAAADDAAQQVDRKKRFAAEEAARAREVEEIIQAGV
jgi:P-aminobenzoate N-oxygenase AurF